MDPPGRMNCEPKSIMPEVASFGKPRRLVSLEMPMPIQQFIRSVLQQILSKRTLVCKSPAKCVHNPSLAPSLLSSEPCRQMESTPAWKEPTAGEIVATTDSLLQMIIRYATATMIVPGEQETTQRAFWRLAGVAHAWFRIAAPHQPFWLSMIPNGLSFRMTPQVTLKYIAFSQMLVKNQPMKYAIYSQIYPNKAINSDQFPQLWFSPEKVDLEHMPRGEIPTQNPTNALQNLAVVERPEPTKEDLPDIVTMYCQGIAPWGALCNNTYSNLRHLYFYGGMLFLE